MQRTLVGWLLCAVLPSASFAHTSEPSPANSTAPACIRLVGTNGVAPDASSGQFEVICRDLANNPLAGIVVTIDLSGCPDMHLCQDQLDPAMTVDCVHKTVSKVTDGAGHVTMTILGGSNGGGNASTLTGGGKIFQGGLQIGSPAISAFDLDGAGGVGANDLSAWLGDFGSGQNYGRSDYDCTGNTGANDLSVWLGAFGAGHMTASCGSTCP